MTQTQTNPEAVALYQQVADRITGMIHAGTLLPGSKAPSVRKLASQWDVSIATVLAAYRLLEAQGKLRSRPQSGYFVLECRQKPCAEVEISTPPKMARVIETSDLMMQILGAHRRNDLVKMGAALAAIPELPIKPVNRLMATIARSQPLASAAYDLPPGCLELRRQLAIRSVVFGCGLSPDEIVTTCGSQEAITLALRAVAKPGDTIAVESPAYYGILQAIVCLGMKALEIPTHPKDGVSLEALRLALDSRPKNAAVKACLFVTNFSNPLGSLMPEERKRELVELLAERDIPLIEDDIYGDLPHAMPAGERPKVCKAYDTTGNVILCSGFSKTIAPGLRVGWCAPGKWLRELSKLKVCTSLATPTLPQLAVARFLETGAYEHALRKIRPVLARQVARMSELVAVHFPEGTKFTRPQGGFVLWIELPKNTDSLAMHDAALARGIAISPGLIFSAKPEYRNHVRLNCGLAWSDEVERAVATLGELAASSLVPTPPAPTTRRQKVSV